MKNKIVPIAVAGVAILAVFLYTRSAKADPVPEKPKLPKKDVEKLIGGVIEKIGGDRPVVAWPVPNLPEPDNDHMSPSNPLPSADLYPGFRGYFRIAGGDTLTKIATRLGIGSKNWRSVRDDMANEWLVATCPEWVRDKYNNGGDFIALYQRYGAVPPQDCTFPGWQAAWKSKTSTAYSWPVMGWRVFDND